MWLQMWRPEKDTTSLFNIPAENAYSEFNHDEILAKHTRRNFFFKGRGYILQNTSTDRANTIR